MLNFLNTLLSNKTKSEPPKDGSSINLDVNFNINIKGEVVMKILSLLLGGSIIVGGVTYRIYSNLPTPETNNNPISQESSDRVSK